MDKMLQKQFDLSRTLNQKIEVTQTLSQQLALKLRKVKEENKDKTLQEMSNNCRHPIYTPINLNSYKTLKGHFDKVNCCSWYPDNIHIVTSSQDGYLLVWDSTTGLKNNLIELDDPYVMSCDVSNNSKLVATGGLDNTLTVYKCEPTFNENGNSLLSIMSGHKEYISAVEFLNNSNTQILSASGDKSSILWDVTKGGHIRNFYGHLGDVLSLSVDKGPATNSNIFVTTSSDRLAMVWDVREPLAIRKFLVDPKCDSSEVKFFPDGNCFAAGCDSGEVKLFDLRADGELASYGLEKVKQYISFNGLTSNYSTFQNSGMEDLDANSFAGSFKTSLQASMDNLGVLSIDFSKSGRLLFSSYAESSNVFIWDVITGSIIGSLNGHHDLISKVCVSPDGLGIATASRDETIKIWST
ncbi:G protein subunit beta [Martiniozyma asiatica (nom. inval.)]|nr:G protein subunit beta [Martiniozyma asiatica]